MGENMFSICSEVGALITTGAVVVGLLFNAPLGVAQPSSHSDAQFLSALHHGGLCCQNRPDVPIWAISLPYESPELAINTGKMVASAMAERPTYDQFQMMRSLVGSQANNRGNQHMDAFDAGEFVVVAVHYYAGAAVECALMKAMGGAMGEAPYWYGPVTYSGGLAVQPGCINFAR